MSKLINLIGKSFGRLKVIKRIQSRSGRGVWLCECACGSDVIVIGKNLRRGLTKSCGCLQKERASQASLKDLSGFAFGRLTVLSRDENVGKTTMWRCRCDCGRHHSAAGCNLTTGDVRSCGCLRREVSSAKLIDMKGQRFGRLRVIRRAPNDTFGNTMWMCKCRCGLEVVVSRDNLVQKRVKSCGCLNAERIATIGKASAADLIGQSFGKLIVLRRIRNKSAYKHARWLCRCSCGKYKKITTGALHRGTKSCGCLVREVNAKLGKLRVGPLSWSWRSDISPEERLLQRSTRANREWREAVYARDNYTCQVCHQRGRLNAHHLDAYNKFKDKRFLVDNGITLCSTCHLAFHEIYGRGNNTTAQFSEFKLQYLSDTKPRRSSY